MSVCLQYSVDAEGNVSSLAFCQCYFSLLSFFFLSFLFFWRRDGAPDRTANKKHAEREGEMCQASKREKGQIADQIITHRKKRELKERKELLVSFSGIYPYVGRMSRRARERDHMFFSLLFSSTDLFLSKFHQSVAKGSCDQLDTSGDIYEKACEFFLVPEIDSCDYIQRTASERSLILMYRIVYFDVQSSWTHRYF